MCGEKREYGLSKDDRELIIKKHFSQFPKQKVMLVLNKANNQSDKILGAILFLSRSGNILDLEACVQLANENELKLLNAATVKDERT